MMTEFNPRLGSLELSNTRTSTSQKLQQLDQERKSMIQQQLEQLQQTWLEIDRGVTHAMTIWDIHFGNCTGGPVVIEDEQEYSFCMIMNDQQLCQQQQQQQNNMTEDLFLFGQHLTALINIENSILNVIEQYQFYVEEYVLMATASPNSASSMTMSSSTSPASLNNEQQLTIRQLLRDLHINDHIDRICQCAALFEKLRKLLFDNEQVFEVKVLLYDMVDLTGYSPPRRRESTDYCQMLEQIHYKFKHKMNQYEQVVLHMKQL
jgi:hypothetical protein